MGVNKFRNTWAMRVIFFSRWAKFNADSKNAIKNPEKVISFPDNCIWTGSGKLSTDITRILLVGSQRVKKYRNQVLGHRKQIKFIAETQHYACRKTQLWAATVHLWSFGN